MPTDRSTTPSAGGLHFITSNPAQDAFQQGQLVAQQLESNDLSIENRIVGNAEQLAGAPTRLRTLNANADTARATADVAQGTVQPRISQANSAASLAGTQAHVAGATAPYTIDNAYQQNLINRDTAAVSAATVPHRIDTSAAGARTATTNADVLQQTAPFTVQNAENTARVGQSNADVTVATQPDRIDQSRQQTRLGNVNADIAEQTAGHKIAVSRAGVRTANAGAVAAEMAGFYKSLELLNAGQTEAAMAVSRETGSDIPQEVITSAEVRNAVTTAAKHAQTIYPNRPRDQQAFIQGFLQDMAQRRAAGGQANDPTAVYNVPGAPKPPELSTNTAGHQPSEIATAEWLVANKVAPDANAAWEMVRRSRSNPTAIYAQVYNGALRSTYGNVSKSKQIADDFMKQLGLQIGPGATPAAAAPGASAPRPVAPGGAQPPTSQNPGLKPPPGLAGAGTREQPFMATTQDHINWFRTNAPAGAVISVQGRPFTK